MVATDFTKSDYYYGFYSAKAARIHGSAIYLGSPSRSYPSGEIEVTAVFRHWPEEGHYAWPDASYVGVVTKFVKDGVKCQ